MHLNWPVFTALSNTQIQLHWATAALAFLIGLVILLRPKGTLPHKTLGAAYSALMLITAGAAFFIREAEVSGLDYLSLKGMTLIHLFIPITLYGVVAGLIGVLVLKNRHRHKWPMIGSFVGGLVIAGVLTFLPGRRMNVFFFGDPDAVARMVSGG